MYSPDKIKKAMWEELAKQGVLTNKREYNVRKYLDTLCELLYLNYSK